MKNFKKKFLAFSVLSLSGVLLMAGVTGCNSKPKAEVAYGGTATFSSEYFDCYMTQKQGEIVELATSEELFAHPVHPYTKSLLSAVPHPDPNIEKNRKRILYNANASHDYSKQRPTLRELVPGHFVYCNDEEEARYLEEFNLGESDGK